MKKLLIVLILALVSVSYGFGQNKTVYKGIIFGEGDIVYEGGVIPVNIELELTNDQTYRDLLQGDKFLIFKVTDRFSSKIYCINVFDNSSYWDSYANLPMLKHGLKNFPIVLINHKDWGPGFMFKDENFYMVTVEENEGDNDNTYKNFIRTLLYYSDIVGIK